MYPILIVYISVGIVKYQNKGLQLVDGTAGTAQFNVPRGIAVGSDGSLYFSDLYSYAIRKVTFE